MTVDECPPGAPGSARITRWITRGTARGPLTFSRKLLYATGLAFAVGVLFTIFSKDYDSAILVILRVGLSFAVVFYAVVAVHHLLTRKARAITSKPPLKNHA